ncbi:MAG: DNA-binding protein [Candidatus Kariarchaeaceae archaeon]|jgi:programmed cell death protein 5
MSDDIEKLRNKRLKELQDAASDQQRQQELDQQQTEAEESYERQKQSILRSILTEGAKQRLINIKLVKPQMAVAIENQLIQLSQSGRIPGGILNEEQLLQMLKQIQQGKRESTIKFKRV